MQQNFATVVQCAESAAGRDMSAELAQKRLPPALAAKGIMMLHLKTAHFISESRRFAG
jgi:hypothetical protein